MMITLYTHCPFCGKRQYVTVEQEDYAKYVGGELAQKAFPYLTPAKREIILPFSRTGLYFLNLNAKIEKLK